MKIGCFQLDLVSDFPWENFVVIRSFIFCWATLWVACALSQKADRSTSHFSRLGRKVLPKGG